MNEQVFESKKFYLEKVQKTINKICFEKCFLKNSGLSQQCYSVCGDKFIKSIGVSLETIKKISRENQTIYHYKLFSENDPFMHVTFDKDAVGYRLGVPPASYCMDLGKKVKF